MLGSESADLALEGDETLCWPVGAEPRVVAWVTHAKLMYMLVI